jgi:hypothetical protein
LNRPPPPKRLPIKKRKPERINAEGRLLAYNAGMSATAIAGKLAKNSLNIFRIFCQNCVGWLGLL